MKTNKSTDSVSLIQQSIIKTIDKLQYHLTKQEGVTGYIHRIRVDIKRLRGWLRLLRIHTDNGDWKIIDQNLIEVAKSLGGTRDDQVINETMAILVNNAKTKKEISAIASLHEQLHMELVPSSIDWKIIKNRLSEELNTIKKVFVSFESIHTIKKGLKHTYKRTIQHGEKAFSTQKTYDELHKLRKWVKYLNYQLAYIGKAYPDFYIKYKHTIDKLGDVLGKAHDLAVIKERLEQLPVKKKNTEDLEIVNDLIDNNINLILKNSRYTYKLIFNLSPEKFTSQIKYCKK